VHRITRHAIPEHDRLALVGDAQTEQIVAPLGVAIQ